MLAAKQTKDSVIKWIGDAPGHWKKSHLKYLASYTNGYAFKPSDWSDTGLPIVRIAQLTSNATPNYYNGMIDDSTLINNGDLLFSWSASLDAFMWEGGPAWLNQHIFKVKPRQGVDKRYLYYLLKFIVPILGELEAHGSAMRHIKRSSLDQSVFVPELDEQKRIAGFLDQELNKIGELIEKQKKLLALLDEKRFTSISSVITSGLNPEANLKDTGVDWIGAIPTGWNTEKVKYIFRIQKRIAGFEGPSVLSITQAGIRKKDLLSGEGQLAQDYSKYQIVESGDFAMNHMDLLTGYVDISPYDGVTSPDYRVFQMTAKYVKRYYLYIFQLCYKKKIFFPLGQGSAQLGRWRLPSEAFKNFVLPVPPIDEQKEIVKYLDEQLAKVDNLKSNVERQLQLLEERRKSLIAGVVTGKIRV